MEEQNEQGMSVVSPSGGINERCPLQARCEWTCIYQGHELDCPYYAENGKDEYVIEDQEERRREHIEAAVSSGMNVPEGHECVTGLNPHGYCGAASYCTEARRCCIGCPNPCNSMCGYIRDNERPQPVEKPDSPIRMIPTAFLHPHPDNPRKNVGDVTELAESIRKNGVLQNLTAIPARQVQDVWDRLLEDPDRTDPDNAYVVVIGHRRLAAAKQAGVEQVPCAVVSMTQTQQVRTMLEENMHREDLTVYEQAQGFQMMLDLGETLETIAKDSGFSTTTVRRRLNLLKLDAEKFKASEARGGTLSDYMELEKIEDPALKNEALDKIGTADFRNALKSAMDEEKKRKIIARWVSEAETFAEPVPEGVDYATLSWVHNYSVYGGRSESVERPEDAGDVKYFYRTTSYDLALYKEKQEPTKEELAEQAAREAERAAAQAVEAKLEEISSRHFELRKDFVVSFNGRKKSAYPDIMLFAANALIGNGGWRAQYDTPFLAELLGLDDEIDFDNSEFEEVKDQILTLDSCDKPRNEAHLLLCAAFAGIDSERNRYWKEEWNSETRRYDYSHKVNPGLDRLYQYLCKLGYEMSEEEKQMQSGTHPLFQTEAAES